MGTDGLPDIDEPVPFDAYEFASAPLGDPSLFTPGYQMVDEHAQFRLGSRSEILDCFRKIVEAIEAFDHDPDIAKIVTPDRFDQFRIVQALNPKPRGAGDPGAVRDSSRGSKMRNLVPSPGVLVTET